MKKHLKYSIATALFLTALLFSLCTRDNLTGTDVGNEKVITVYLADGKTPAPNTNVRFYSVGDTSKLYKYQAITDTKGQYSLVGVKDLDGMYNVWDQFDDTLMAYQDSVLITPNTYTVKDDTLQKTGSLTGIVGLQPNDDPRTVTVQVLGTHKFSNVDSSGHFLLSGMAAGVYGLKISTTLPLYTSIYPNVTVRSGFADTAKDTFRLIYTGIPVVMGMKVSYDTLNGVVRLSWKKVQYQNLQDYLIYRSFKDSVQWPSTPLTNVLDTTFIDSIFKKSTSTGPFSFSDTNNYHFKYRVCVRNNSDQIGLPYKYVDIKTPSTTLVKTYFAWKFINTIADSASINDTVSFVVGYKNATRKNMKLSWYVNNKDSLFKIKNDSSYTGIDTIKYVWTTASKPKIYVSMVDQGSTIWWDSTTMQIVQDVPVAYAGNDTFVSINDLVRLHGSAKDGFGFIVKWEWDLGNNGVFIQTSTADTSITAPASWVDSIKCVLRVTDDDGNISKDTVEIRTFLTDNDGNLYKTVRIGNQLWMAENLKTTKYNDGTSISLVTENSEWFSLTTPGYCWYNNDVTNKADHGALYNWYTVNTGKLAPAGWHVPTDAEWTTLGNYLGGDPVAGGKLKEAGLAHWHSPNTGATNETGFSALPGGYRHDAGTFDSQSNYGYWWSATAYDASQTWFRSLYYDVGNLSRYISLKRCGSSVRLLRD
jgi:uncharacterized protein (TIGR02145 family)